MFAGQTTLSHRLQPKDFQNIHMPSLLRQQTARNTPNQPGTPLRTSEQAPKRNEGWSNSRKIDRSRDGSTKRGRVQRTCERIRDAGKDGRKLTCSERLVVFLLNFLCIMCAEWLRNRHSAPLVWPRSSELHHRQGAGCPTPSRSWESETSTWNPGFNGLCVSRCTVLVLHENDKG
jgi:hypothetical protein